MLQKLNTKRGGFTLVEIMIVVAIIALLASIAVPNFLRSRKRSQATQVLEDLRLIDSAIDQYAIENNKKEGDDVTWDELRPYLKTGTRLETSGGVDILENSFGEAFEVDTIPQVNTDTYNALSDVASEESGFWGAHKTAAAPEAP